MHTQLQKKQGSVAARKKHKPHLPDCTLTMAFVNQRQSPSLINRLIRRKRTRQLKRLLDVNIRKRISLLVSYFFIMVVLHVIAMLVFEDLSLSNAIWITLTTVTTVGYGDLSAQTDLGRTATVILLYFGGIFILAKIAGDYFDFRLERRQKMLNGLWRWKMKDHIVIINTPRHNAEQYFERLISQFRQIEDFDEIPIQLLTPAYPNGLHPSLQRLGVIHYSGKPNNEDNLSAVNISEASQVLVLASDETDVMSDSYTFDILHRLKEMQVKGNLLVECVDDKNRSRFLAAGANSVIRPIRAYPELIVRAIVAPGCEKVLENLFTHGGNHTRRYDVNIDDIRWSDIVCALINNSIGTALAYLDQLGNVIIDPSPSAKINASGLIVLIREQHVPTTEELINAVKSCEEV